MSDACLASPHPTSETLHQPPAERRQVMLPKSAPASSLLLLLALTLLLSGCGFARLDHLMVARDGRWVQTGGEFFVVREGKRLDVSQGMTLKKDDLLETGPDTAATLSFEGDLKGSGDVILFPSTRVKILNPSLGIDFGKIFLKVKGYFNIHFEYGTAGSEGTEYLVEADRAQNVRITVLEGVVRLSSKSNSWRTQRLGEREQARLTPAQAPQTRRLGQSEFNEMINEINRVWEGTGRRDIPVIVPDLGGMPRSRAIETLRRERLQSGQVTRRLTQRAEVGAVVGQNPAANARVPVASRVALEVEAEPAKVPDLRGVSQRNAERRLRSSKLHLGQVEQILSDGKVGRVVRQLPAAGTIVMRDSAVDIGVVAESALVPDLHGRTLNDARRQLGQRKLRMGPLDYRITGNLQPDQVLSQHPSAGNRVFAGSEVRLVVEAQSRLVPGLIGQQRQAAEERLRALQLTVRPLAAPLSVGIAAQLAAKLDDDGFWTNEAEEALIEKYWQPA